MAHINIRSFKAEDIDAVVNLFRDTIHTVNAKDYTQAQLDAWAPKDIKSERWCQKMLSHFTVVAVVDGTITGFADLHDNGYFDHLFVHKDYQGQGIATQLVSAIEKQAVKIGVNQIEVHVSITARSFFLKKGYTVKTPQQVHYNGQDFTNYVMNKDI